MPDNSPLLVKMCSELSADSTLSTLYQAVATRKTSIVRHILSTNSKISLFGVHECDGRKLLMEAKDSSPTIFKLLLNCMESDANEDDKKLITAVVKGDLKKVKALLKRGIRLRESDDPNGFPSRYIFSKYNKEVRKEMFLLMIDHGYDAGLRAQNYNLLHHFCRSVEKYDTDAVEMAEILVNFGATINKFDHLDWTPLLLSVSTENVGLIDYLIKKGAEQDPGNQVETLYLFARHDSRGSRSVIFEQILSRGLNINQKDDHGATVLHYACDESDHLTIKFLIQNGADLSVRDNYGGTPFSTLNTEDENYKTCLHVMIRELARLKFENLPVSNVDLDLIASNKNMQIHFRNCTEELRKMRMIKFYGPYSYHWVMETSKENLRKLAYLAKNPKFIKNYKNSFKKFPRYAYLLRKTLKKAFAALEELKYVEKRLASLFGATFPSLILKKFADNLTDKDLPT